MERPKCENCPYWDQITKPDPMDENFVDKNPEGLCRKNAPRWLMAPDGEDIHEATDWPLTLADDWCGAHPKFEHYLRTLGG